MLQDPTEPRAEHDRALEEVREASEARTMNVHERHELYQLLTVTGNAHRARLSQWFERGGWMTPDVDGTPVGGSSIRWESMLGARSTIAGSSYGESARKRAAESADVWAVIRRTRDYASTFARECAERSDAFEERELVAGRCVPGRSLTPTERAALTRYHRLGALIDGDYRRMTLPEYAEALHSALYPV